MTAETIFISSGFVPGSPTKENIITFKASLTESLPHKTKKRVVGIVDKKTEMNSTRGCLFW